MLVLIKKAHNGPVVVQTARMPVRTRIIVPTRSVVRNHPADVLRQRLAAFVDQGGSFVVRGHVTARILPRILGECLRVRPIIPNPRRGGRDLDGDRVLALAERLQS